MGTGVIFKALSGFYYIRQENTMIECKARGKFRKEGMSPLVGDLVEFSAVSESTGIIEQIRERKNAFIRPAVANIDVMIFIASNAIPKTDPFLIDRVSVIAEMSGCEFLLVINKTDLDPADELRKIYTSAGIQTICTSAVSGEGIPDLLDAIRGKFSAVTGNSGVGKSSILNAMIPGLQLKTDDVSNKLGRGKHTTRHVEVYSPAESTYIADTPGFASFDVQMIHSVTQEQLPECFPDFRAYSSECRFQNCLHVNEPGCAVREALGEHKIQPTRMASYLRLYDMVKLHKPWDD